MEKESIQGERGNINLDIKNTYSDNLNNNKINTLKGIFSKQTPEDTKNTNNLEKTLPPSKPFQPVIGPNMFENQNNQAIFQNNFLNSKFNTNYDENTTGLNQVKEEMNKKQRLVEEKENYFINKGDYTPVLPIFTRLQERKTNDFCIYGAPVIIIIYFIYIFYGR